MKQSVLQTVLEKLRALSPEGFQQELDKHRYTPLALAFRELQDFSEYLNEEQTDGKNN